VNHKILEKYTGSNFSDIGHSTSSLDRSVKARETKPKINYWDHTKIKHFCIAKENINKMKKTPSEWKKVFANDKSDRG